MRDHLQTPVSDPAAIHSGMIQAQELFRDRRSCSQRHSDRMPLQLRDLYGCLARCAVENARVNLQKLAWKMRKKWLSDLRTLSLRRRVANGGVRTRSKKLHEITAILLPQEAGGRQASLDRSEWSTELQRVYEEKWGSHCLQERVDIVDFVLRSDGVGVQLDAARWLAACEACNHASKCDEYGVSVAVLRAFIIACPEESCAFLNKLVASTPLLSWFQVEGRVFGKSSGVTEASATRAILPLPALLQVVGAGLAAHLHSFIDRVLPPTLGCWMGARPGTQSLEIAHGLQLVIEMGMDMKSGAALAQADIRAFYDSMKMLRICRWLVTHGMPAQDAACMLRHQMCPKIWLNAGSLRFHVPNRSRGGLTGSRLAGAFGRVPVETTMSDRAEAWQPLGFALDEGTTLMCSAYVDNLFSCSRTVQGAIAILEDASYRLATDCGHDIKDSSRSVMVCKGSRERSIDEERWPMVESFDCLGHIIQNDSGIRACFSNVKRSLWGSFWGNCGHASAKQLPVEMKFALMTRTCTPSLAYRCSRWPPQPTIAGELDRIQRKMVAVILRIPRRPDEPINAYCRRRRREAASVCNRLGPWSDLWFRRAKLWDEHIIRGHNPYSWPCLLKPFHDSQWLEEQRMLHNMQGTSTRVSPGRPHMRWDEGILLVSQGS